MTINIYFCVTNSFFSAHPYGKKYQRRFGSPKRLLWLIIWDVGSINKFISATSIQGIMEESARCIRRSRWMRVMDARLNTWVREPHILELVWLHLNLPDHVFGWTRVERKLTSFHRNPLQHTWIEMNISTTKQVFNVFFMHRSHKIQKDVLKLKHIRNYGKKNNRLLSHSHNNFACKWSSCSDLFRTTLKYHNISGRLAHHLHSSLTNQNNAYYI